MKALAESVVATHRVEEKYYAEGGKFLPLDAWNVQGFDTEAIKARSATEDTMRHPVLGMVYRVQILEMQLRVSRA